MTFTVPRSFRVFITALMCGMTLFLFGAVIAHGHRVVHAAFVTGPLFAAIVWVFLELQSNVTVDDRTIVYDRLGRPTSISLPDISDLHYSPPLTGQSMPHSNRSTPCKRRFEKR